MSNSQRSALSRRRFVTVSGGLAALALAGQIPELAQATPALSANPFSLGVASGDPLPGAVVIWTRLAPDPLNGGGMPETNVPVRWRVAIDEQMRGVIKQGTAVALPQLGHSVHIDVRGLEPARWYWYQFHVGGWDSPIGRMRTAPARGASLEHFAFAFASCNDYQNGYYAALQRMSEEDLDLVVHLGDYIYEYGPDANAVRQHSGPEIITLSDYRNRYAQYKLDPAFQAAHANCPWVVTWDDHEVENNYADEISENNDDPAVFLQRRAAAYQAYYEHQPLRITSLPQGADMQLFRRLSFGNLLEFSVLDTRQYRSDQPCGDGLTPRCPQALDPNQTMTGPQQERWLLSGLNRSEARWNIIAQQTMFAQFDFLAGQGGNGLPPQLFNVDQWDGYVAARSRILGFLQARRPNNPVVLTGDIHSSWVHDIKADFENSASETLATELVCTSLSSSFPTEFIAPVTAALRDNPHTRYFNGALRGYVRCEVTPEQYRADFRLIDNLLDPNSPIKTAASFVIEDGVAGAVRV